MCSDRTQTTQANILVVDDTPDNLRLLSSMLTERGYKVRKALSGQMGLTSAKTALPDLILLDINMPGMDGFEVCTQLKANEQTRHVPIIFISALNDVLDKVKAFTIGGVDYITKPFQVQEVIARVENQLTLMRQQQQLLARTAQLEQEVKERQRAEEAVRQSAIELRTQNLVLTKLTKSPALHQGDLKAAFQEITEASARNIGVERASVWLYDNTATKLQCHDLFEQSRHQHSQGIELAATDYPAYFQALQQDEAIAADDAHTDPRTQEFSQVYLTSLGIASMLDMPIRVKGETLKHENANRLSQP
jgi:two-component system, sensor histidine kinase and response regulator